MKIKEFFSKILDYIYYRKCYLCSGKCLEISLCQDCYDKVFSEMSFFNTEKNDIKIYTGAIYEGDLLKIIRALKYHKKSEFEKILSEIIIKTIENYKINLENFLICPVPIHDNRLKKRKYNHMELVADSVGKYFGIDIKSDLIKRTKDTLPLYKLSIPERKKAITGAFCAADCVKGKNILLVDDIITSGTTANELYKILKENGAEDIIFISATRAKSFIN